MPIAPTDKPLSQLRGAGVEVDARRVGRFFAALGAFSLLVLAVVFFVVGLNKNHQITELQRHGVAVEARITGCLGLLGGSGSNAAGYSCQGSFALDGATYSVTIPGNVLRPQGSTVRIVSLPTDPHLVETATTLGSERATVGVFVLPIVLLGAFLALVGVFTARRRVRNAR